MKRYALTAVGRDRPGIVAAVTRVLFEHDCNIEDSSMTRLEDEFAVILIMAAPDDTDLDALRKKISAVGAEMGLTTQINELGENTGAGDASNYIITLHGADKAGIVYKTADLLREKGVNVTDLETSVVGEGADKIYIMVMEVFTPEKSLDDIRRGLDALGEELGVTIKIKPIEDYEPL